jgi:periplasmic serine protease
MDAINLSSQLASDWLIQYMFSGEEPVAAKKKATKIVKKLNANNKSHSRHFTVDFCKELGLNITELESDQTLQELVLSVHHAFIITIDATAATKLIENQNGARYITSQKK